MPELFLSVTCASSEIRFLDLVNSTTKVAMGPGQSKAVEVVDLCVNFNYSTCASLSFVCDIPKRPSMMVRPKHRNPSFHYRHGLTLSNFVK